MAASTGKALSGVLESARYCARSRNQRPSSAHCVLWMLQSDPETSVLLTEAGLRENELVSALKLETEEQDAVLERVVERAAAVAQRTGAPEVRAMHLLVALTRDPRAAGFRCLEHARVPAARVNEMALRALGLSDASLSERDRTATIPPPPPRTMPPAVPRPPSVRPPVRELARKPDVRPPPPPGAAGSDRASGEGPASTRPSARPPGLPMPRPTNRRVLTRPAPVTAEGGTSSGIDEARFPTLAALGRDLVVAAKAGQIDPVIGREKELDQLLDVLCRRRANNPLLVGPPGVGKTALAHALARALEAGKAPGLEGKTLIEISAGALLSGTGVRGALAERLRRLRDEVVRAGNVIVFLDEIHALLGAGDGADDLGAELKTALNRGDFPCIGATTEAEAKRTLDRDPALARRFSTIYVGEPSADDAKAILAGLVPRYEAHHQLRYERSAIEAAVDLGVRWLADKQLPDKALSALDLAGARVRRAGGRTVDVAAVAAVIAQEAHVPLERVLVRDGERLLALERELAARVVGQTGALARIADALRKSAAGFRGKRPLGTFLFLGPTGVGKTETAKAIADVLFSATSMSRFDMSELSEAHAVARLFGAPPGYVGHDAGGQLTEAVRRRPYQLVLLDEIEKAHPDVLLALLPLLDEGRLTDGRGRTVDFTNTVVVMTSNLGAEAAHKTTSHRIGFGAETEGERTRSLELAAILGARRALPPELWNRIDEPLFFGPLGRADVAEIARRMLASIGKALLAEHGIVLDVEPSALEALAEAGGFDATLGARPMRRTIGRLVESPLATRVLSGEIARGDRVVLSGLGTDVRLTTLELAAAE